MTVFRSKDASCWLLLACLSSFLFPGVARAGQAASSENRAAQSSGADQRQTTTARPGSDLTDTVSIPGPMRSFLRMAGLSQQAPREEILPFVSHQVALAGYVDSRPTEFLLLLERYLVQARELETLAGAEHTIRIAKCADAAALFRVLGYQPRHGCGGDVLLEASNPERAFITINSGFPLMAVEESFRNGVPFVYPYASSKIPVLFHEADWVKLNLTGGQRVQFGNCLEVLLHDPGIARLYWALSKMAGESRTFLQRSLGLRALLPMGPALDFYGSRFSISGGHVLVPGGATAEPVWKTLVGASPETPSGFAAKLFTKDAGWLSVYFDALSRVDASQQQHFTDPLRFQRFYDAFRNADPNSTALRGIYPKGSQLLVLAMRLQWEPNGDPHLPGGVDVWKQVLQQRPREKLVGDWARRVHTFERPDQIVEAMFARARGEEEDGSLQLFISLCDLDRRRATQQPLSGETVTFLARNFVSFGQWYPVFSEFPSLTDAAIVQFITVGDKVEHLRGQAMRANALGSLQANLGLWQILARQHQIPEADQTKSWLAVIEPFQHLATATQLFDSARTSFQAVLAAVPSTGTPPGDIIDLLAGPVQSSPDGVRVHDQLAEKMRLVLQDQQLVPVSTLFDLGDGLKRIQKTGEKGSDDLLSLAGELRNFEMPRPIFTNGEKASWAPGVYISRHAELQVQTDFTKVLKGAASSAQLEAARGELAPFLRDTLVGLNYAFYEPPGAQILHINPLFVRAHDFLSLSMIGSAGVWHRPTLIGAGVSAGGGAYLMGSLVDLPHSLATAEENFLIPENIQALIWIELVPSLVESATVPRWWTVTPQELHAVGLYQRSGEEILRASSKNQKVQTNTLAILSSRISPKRLEQIKLSLSAPNDAANSAQLLMPAEVSYLAYEYRQRLPDEAKSAGPANEELSALLASSPKEADYGVISADFGVSHPTLAGTNSRELLNMEPFPLGGGSASRMFAESIESSNLYWARLADELGYPPAMLHRLVPELTRQMIGKIFATNIEDWPAVMRALRATGDEFRKNQTSSNPKPAVAYAGQIPVARRDP